MTLVVCEHTKIIDRYLNGELWHSGSSGDLLFVCNSFPVKWILEENDLPFRHIDGAVSMDEARKIDVLGVKLAQNWYLHLGNDITLFNGLSLGSMAEYDMIGFTNNVLKYYVGFANLISRSRPALVVCDSDSRGMRGILLQELKERFEFELRFVAAPEETLPFEDVFQHSFADFYNKEIFSRNGEVGRLGIALKGVVRAGARRLLAWFSSAHWSILRLSGKRIGTTLALSSSQINHFISRWSTDPLRQPLVLLSTAPPNISLLVRSILKGARFMFLPRVRLAGSESEELLQMRGKLLGLGGKTSSLETYLWEGYPIDAVLSPLVVSFAKHKLPQLGVLSLQLGKAIRDNSIKLVVLPNDVVQVCKGLVLVARKHRARSLVVQHGFHGHRLDQDKRYADMLAVWGELDKQQYVEEGIDPGRIFVTGSPTYDKFAEHPPQPNDEIKPIRRVLIITTNLPGMSSAVDFCPYERFVPTVIKELRQRLGHLEIVVKIHPAEPKGLYERMLREFKDVKVQQHVDLFPLIEWSDLVIAAMSTAVFECVLLGKPTLCVQFAKGRWNLPAPLDGLSGIPVAYDERGLSVLLDQMLDTRESPIDFSNPNLRSFLGQVDGRAKERLQTVIAGMAENTYE